MPIPDPIPALKRQAGAEFARFVAGCNGDDIGACLRTDRSRIADLRHGRLERFSLETLLRLLDRAGMQVELRVTPRPFGRRWSEHERRPRAPNARA